MFTQLALDLRLARKTTGLTQDDCATMMGISRKHWSRLERGKRAPSFRELLILTIIFNRTFENHVSETLSEARATVRAGIPQLATSVREQVDFTKRRQTLDRIEADLMRPDSEVYGN